MLLQRYIDRRINLLDTLSGQPCNLCTKRLCAKASGAILCQASKHDVDHGEVHPGFFTAGKHLIVFGESAPRRKPGEGTLDNPAVWKHMKTTGSDLLPIDDGILRSPDAS